MDKIKLYNREIKKNAKGDVIKYLETSKHLPKVREVYFSEIKKNKIKAWKKNLTSDQFLFVYKGKIKIILYDDRKLKKGKKYNYYLGEGTKFSRIYLPKNIWYGFKGLNQKNIVINSLRIQHNKCKFISSDVNNKNISTVWK